MKTIYSWLFMGLLLLPGAAGAQLKYSKVSIQIPPQGLAWLASQGVDIDHGEFNRQQNTFTTSLHSQDIAILRKTGTAFKILVDDEVAAYLKESKHDDFYRMPNQLSINGKMQFDDPCGSALAKINVPVGFISGTYGGGYYRYSEMQKRIDSMVRHYPNLVQKTTLPFTTHGGRQLTLVKISDNVTADENEPEALYTGLHHAREGMSMMNLIFFMQYLVENYNSDNRVRELLNNRELFFIPCVNPDGYVYNETNSPGGGGMWRKNRRNNGGSYGVDLNRNYSVDWGITGPNISTSHSPSNDAYVGPSAFSEPETQAIKALSESRHFTIAIDHHAYGSYYVTPYGVPASHPFTTADRNFYSYASALMSKYNGYFAGDGMATVNYYAVGNSRDWHISGDIGRGTKQKTYGYTVEIGTGNFWPSPSQIIPIAKSMFFANMQMAYMAGSYFELQDLDKISVQTRTGQFNFSLRRIGLTDAPVTISIIPIENIQVTSDPVTINSMANYFDVATRSFSYGLPANMTAGKRIRFAYQVSSGGITTYDTVTKFYQPNDLFTDDIEGSLTDNWTFTGTWGASTTAAYQGTRSLSESPTGNYRLNTSSSATYKQAINLSNATSAYLSFWVRHRSENAQTRLEVQLSDNGIGTGANFRPLCGQHTITENIGTLQSRPSLTGMREVWTREIIDLQDYLQRPNVGLRFQFNSAGSVADDGFYIDNIEIIKSTNVALGVKFISVSAKKVWQGALISWEAVTDLHHDHFEVERSEDGIHFITIGEVRNQPWQFLDPAPAPNSFYRIKGVDKQGNPDYSKIVSLQYLHANTIQVGPNPVGAVLQLHFNLDQAAHYTLTVADMTGRIHYTGKLYQPKGSSLRSIAAGTWTAQVYWVKLADPQTGHEQVYKIVKQ